MTTDADLHLAAPGDDSAAVAPRPQKHLVRLPEPLGYRIKKRILGPPLDTDQLSHERLGKPTALAVFASDNLSSSAYATEEFLRVLVPAVGLAAFSFVMPLTIAMLVVLALLILSYRQTIKAYPNAGGAYIVTKDNLGTLWAQVAGVALLAGYVLTAAVSAAAGAAAAASAVPALASWVLPLAIFFLLIIAGGNLKGVKESGKAFAVPTYFFVANMAVLLGVGLVRWLTGGLEHVAHEAGHELVDIGAEDPSLWMGIGLFVLLRAFAHGGAAVTGVEAISNGVPAFKEPAWKHARQTLVIMGSLLGVMFFGLSALATQVEAVPYEEGTPTVISQIGRAVFGADGGGLGLVLWFSLQLGTMLILILAANTSYADFPRLASFQASDNFMPRQLTKRGHRLVFSNGIITLTAAAIVLLVFTGASVERLIPLYAIGVFTGFALSQAGMTVHHRRYKEPGWRAGMVVNGVGAVVSVLVLVISAISNFWDGAWIIIAAIPLAVIPLFRLNKQYEAEEDELETGAKAAAEAPILNRHVVIVLLDELDMAAARAIQYARSLTPDELIAVHFDLDPIRTKDLTESWSRLGLTRLSLDVVDCPDRRIERAAAEVAARHLLDGDTEVTVLLPRLEYSKFWHRLVHDRTADSIAETLSQLPHCNVTIVPFHLARGEAPIIVAPPPPVPEAAPPPTPEGNGDAGDGAARGRIRDRARPRRKAREAPAGVALVLGDLPADRVPIAELEFRQRAKVGGKVYSMRVQPWSGVASLELNLVDGTGALTVVFFGRRHLAGVGVGSRLVVEGVVGEHRGTMAMLNPAYEIRSEAPAPTS